MFYVFLYSECWEFYHHFLFWNMLTINCYRTWNRSVSICPIGNSLPDGDRFFALTKKVLQHSYLNSVHAPEIYRKNLLLYSYLDFFLFFFRLFLWLCMFSFIHILFRKSFLFNFFVNSILKSEYTFVHSIIS